MTTNIPVNYDALLAETINIPLLDGGTISGYYARPLGSGPFPGVIVIFEAFGMMTHTKEMVRKFAASGYLSIAPDLYSREGPLDPTDMRAVMQRMGGISDTQVINDTEGTAQFLKQQPTSNGKVGAIGHCSGGRHSLLFACNTQSLDAAVDCYGGRIITDELTQAMPKAVIDMIPDLACPLLGLFGETDANPTPDHIDQLAQRLASNNKQYEFKTYPDPVGHGFFCEYRPSYNQEAAIDGWERIFTFFEKHLV